MIRQFQPVQPRGKKSHGMVGKHPGILRVAASLLAFAFLGPARSFATPPAAKPNVILITIDTLRADHLGCYGDEEVKTPNIDALASHSARFAHAYTPVPITLPSHTCIMTGSFPMATGIHDFSGNELRPNTMTLARVLHEHGYTTAAFIGAAVLDSRFGLNQGFDTYFDHFDFNPLDEASLDEMSRPGDQVVDNALDWLATDPAQPIFLWVHLYDPHYPYTPHEPYASRYRSHPYDGEIAFADAQVGRLFAYLRDNEMYDGSVIALMADHGEGLGEHGEKTHGFYIYNSTLHVPLIICIPGEKSQVITSDASLVDVMPTLLQALRIPIPPSVQGRSLLGEILGEPHTAEELPHLYSETYLPLLHFRWSQLRGLQWHGLKYIQAPRPEIYDLRTDPHELRNLYSTHLSLAHEMAQQLDDVIRQYTPSAGTATAPKEMTDPALLERLRSLGYVAVSGGNFTPSGGKPLPDPKDRIRVYEMVSEAMSDGQHGRYQESLRMLREADKADPACLPIHYLMALDYFRDSDYQKAVAEFRQVLGIDPHDALATYYLGLTELRTGDLDAAATTFERALKLDPTNFSAAYNLGSIYTRKNRAEDALRLFERAAAINPKYAQAYEAQGEMQLYLGEIPEAVQALRRAVQLQPNFRKAHYELGRAYQAQGKTAEAQREFIQARTGEP